MDKCERGESSFDLARTIAILESFVRDPKLGLPEDLFQLVSRLTPLLSVDLLLQDSQARTLLTWRHDVAYGRGWHIPGGIIRYKERAVDRIHAGAYGELGADVSYEADPLVVVEHLKPDSRERGHVVSFLIAAVCSRLLLRDCASVRRLRASSLEVARARNRQAYRGTTNV